jgi:hypothetical protein
MISSCSNPVGGKVHMLTGPPTVGHPSVRRRMFHVLVSDATCCAIPRYDYIGSVLAMGQYMCEWGPGQRQCSVRIGCCPGRLHAGRRHALPHDHAAAHGLTSMQGNAHALHGRCRSSSDQQCALAAYRFHKLQPTNSCRVAQTEVLHHTWACPVIALQPTWLRS